MKLVDEIEAKKIVRRDLESWIGTLDDFHEMASEMHRTAYGVNTVEKREVFVSKFLGRLKPRIYAKKTKIGLSHTLVIGSDLEGGGDVKLSRAETKKIAVNNQLMTQYLYRLSKKSTFVFIVKDGSKSVTSELIMLLFKTRGSDKDELFSFHSVGVIKKHCLERIVQRLGLENIYEAIEEVLPAVTWLEGSGSELAGRVGGYGDSGIKRHVPTPNGALLLLTNLSEMGLAKPVQECSLITWIHKRQFRRNQEVTARDFKYVMTINYYLSSPELSDVMLKLEKDISNVRADGSRGKVFVALHGARYPADDFLLSLKKRVFLDFVIDFEKDIPTR
jgi:hypothetical protein